MPATPKQVVRNYLKAITQGPLENLPKVAARDIKGYQGQEVAQGLEALAAYCRHYRQAYPGWKISLGRMVAEGSWVAAQGTATAKGLNQSFAALYKVSRGRVTEVHIYAGGGAFEQSVPLVP